MLRIFPGLKSPPPPQFDVRNLSEFENKEDEEVAEELAGYFNKISKKFDPLQLEDVPSCARTNTAASKAWELVQLLQEILENAEDYRAAAIVTLIDYSKAFNRMSFQLCLELLARNGASSNLLRIVAAFLTDCSMVVKVGSLMSEP